MNYIIPTTEVTISTASTSNTTVTTEQVQSQCDLASICVIPNGITVHVTSNLNVGALIVRGSFLWTDDTIQSSSSSSSSSSSFICAGYVAIEEEGSWKMTIQQPQNYAWIYIKDNGAIHSQLRSRAFGAVGSTPGSDYPLIDIEGRELQRTWTLLSQPLVVGDSTMKVLHHPTLMGWNVGDRQVCFNYYLLYTKYSVRTVHLLFYCYYL